MQPNNFRISDNETPLKSIVRGKPYHKFISVDAFFSQKIGFDYGCQAEEKIERDKIMRPVSSSEDEQIKIKERLFFLPKALSHIKDEIQHSQYILSLEDNWDENGAKKISEGLYFNSIEFLVTYSSYLFNNKDRTIIAAPEINPCVDGSIDMSWRTGNMRLLINFKELQGAFHCNFYGDLNDPEKSKKGYVELDSFDSSFAEWLKFLKN